MWNQIKRHLARGIFKKEIREIRKEKRTLKALNKIQKQNNEDWEKRVSEVTVTDLVREQLTGFDFSKVRGDLLSEIPPDQMPVYLEEALTIMEGDVFPYVVEYVKRQQVDETINGAESIEHVNFGRATLNGVALINEAMESLVTEYNERHTPKEPFDKHSAT